MFTVFFAFVFVCLLISIKSNDLRRFITIYLIAYLFSFRSFSIFFSLFFYHFLLFHHFKPDVLGQAAKKRVASAPVVPKTTPVIVPTPAKATQNGPTAIPPQPTPGLPQSASVSAQKAPISGSVITNTSTSTATNIGKIDAKPTNLENIQPESSNDTAAAALSRPITQNPLTAIMNDKTMILTRQHRHRVRVKYSGERTTRTLNERNTTKENIPKTVKPAGNGKDEKPRVNDVGNDAKQTENVPAVKGEGNASVGGGGGSVGQSASARASAAAAHKVKKRARKIASSANERKMQRTYKIDGKSGDKMFPCRHCGRKYRWKSTLRRHENDECGNKEPAHQCPYCSYKAKQRGNLGVHVRKHHSDKPKLESSRKRKTI